MLIILVFAILYRKDEFSLMGLPIALGLWYLYLFKDKVESKEAWTLLAIGIISLILTQGFLTFHLIADYYDNLFNKTHWDISLYLYKLDEYYTHYLLFFPAILFTFLGVLALIRRKYPTKLNQIIIYNVIFGILIELIALAMIEGHLLEISIVSLSLSLIIVYYTQKEKLSKEEEYVISLLALSLGTIIGLFLVKLFIFR